MEFGFICFPSGDCQDNASSQPLPFKISLETPFIGEAWSGRRRAHTLFG